MQPVFSTRPKAEPTSPVALGNLYSFAESCFPYSAALTWIPTPNGANIVRIRTLVKYVTKLFPIRLSAA